MDDYKNINPDYVNGEPVCSEMSCPFFMVQKPNEQWYRDRFFCMKINRCIDEIKYCIPALRHDRDDARRELCKAKEWYEPNRYYDSYCGGQRSYHHSPEEYAATRGWSYLYPQKKEE